VDLVFGSPVSGLEKDWNWTGLGLIGPQIPRTATDRNRSLVLGLYIFGNIRADPGPVVTGLREY
jgi:hypothetical protein